MDFGTAIILAGGKSSRMGFDKQCLKINNQLLIEITLKSLSDIFSDIIVVTNKCELYKDLDVRVTSDIIKQKGPLSGFHAGLALCESTFSYVIACDMPTINIDYIKYMINAIKTSQKNLQACVTLYKDHLEPFNAFYNKNIFSKLESYLKNDTIKNKSIYSFIQTLDTLYIEEQKAKLFSPSWDMFKNINSTDDLKNI